MPVQNISLLDPPTHLIWHWIGLLVQKIGLESILMPGPIPLSLLLREEMLLLRSHLPLLIFSHYFIWHLEKHTSYQTGCFSLATIFHRSIARSSLSPPWFLASFLSEFKSALGSFSCWNFSFLFLFLFLFLF